MTETCRCTDCQCALFRRSVPALALTSSRGLAFCALLLVLLAGVVIVVDPTRGQPLIELAQAIAWPLVALGALLAGGAPIRSAVVAFIGRLNEVGLKGAGLDAHLRTEVTQKVDKPEGTNALTLAATTTVETRADELSELRQELENVRGQAHAQGEFTEAVINAFQAKETEAKNWRLEFLAYFLVAKTQQVLTWFSLVDMSLTLDQYHQAVQGPIPNMVERTTLLGALLEQGLIVADPPGLITPQTTFAVTAQGREFLSFVAWKRTTGYTPYGPTAGL